MTSTSSRFARGSGQYACNCCGRQTRSTGRGDNEQVRLCAECFDLAGIENHLSDTGELGRYVTEARELFAALRTYGKNPESLFPEIAQSLAATAA